MSNDVKHRKENVKQGTEFEFNPLEKKIEPLHSSVP